jgi:hypothetical protein
MPIAVKATIEEKENYSFFLEESNGRGSTEAAF